MNPKLKRAIKEVSAQEREKREAPKMHAECPDCAARLRGEVDPETGKLSLALVEHRT